MKLILAPFSMINLFCGSNCNPPIKILLHGWYSLDLPSTTYFPNIDLAHLAKLWTDMLFEIEDLHWYQVKSMNAVTKSYLGVFQMDFRFSFFIFFYCAAVAHAWTHPTLEHEHTQICVLYNSSIKAKRFIYNPEISYVEFNGTHWYDALIKLELLSRLLLLWLCIVDLFLSGHVKWCLSVLQEIGGASLNHARFTFTPIRSWSYFHIICK